MDVVILIDVLHSVIAPLPFSGLILPCYIQMLHDSCVFVLKCMETAPKPQLTMKEDNLHNRKEYITTRYPIINIDQITFHSLRPEKPLKREIGYNRKILLIGLSQSGL